MAYSDLHAFLVMLAKHPKLRKVVRAGGPEAEKLMEEAGLSKTERTLVRSQDKAAIRKYMGDKYAAAILIRLDE
jgi:hypothetical protein